MDTRVKVEIAAGIVIFGALVFAGWSLISQKEEVSLLLKDIGALVSVIKDPPVKIVGGAMTFRTIDSNGWQSVPGGSYSTAVAQVPSKIVLKRVVDPATGKIADLSLILTNSNPFTIEVDARNKAGNDTSGNYVLVGASGKTVTITATGGTASFYRYPLDPDSTKYNHYFGKRYKDHGGQCTWDDFCEHIYQVQITLDTGKPTKYLCPDGECRVEIW